MLLFCRLALRWISSSFFYHLRLLALLLVLLPTRLWAQSPSWQAALGNATTELGTITPRNVASDGTGNVYVVGSYVGTIQLGSTTLSSTMGTNRLPSTDAFVAKWSIATNTWGWALGGGTSDYDQATNVAVGSTGSLYVSGYLGSSATATFGSLTFPATFELNLFVLKVSDTGSTVTPNWGLTGQTTSNYSAAMVPSATALAVSGSHVYVAGQFSGPTLKLGTLQLTNAGGTASTNDAFVASLTDGGLAATWQWVRQGGGSSDDGGQALTTSGDKVYWAGYFQGTASFGSTFLTSRGAAGTSDIFLARLSETGSIDWALRAGGDGDDRATALVASGSSVYVAGNAASLAPDFAPLQLTSPPNAGVLDLFVAKLSDAGPAPAFTWVERAGGASTERLTGLALGSAGALYVTGDFLFASALRFGTTTLANPGTLTDIFVARLNDNGASASYVWATQLGSEATDAAAGVAADADQVYIGAAVVGSVTTLGRPVQQQLLTGGRANVAVGQLTAAGSWQQAQQAFIGGSFQPVASVVDNCGLVYVAGRLSGQTRLGTTILSSVGSSDIVVAKWNPAGNSWTWAQTAGGIGADQVTGITVNNRGQVYICGSFANGSGVNPTTITFGSIVLSHMGTSNLDAFVAKLTDTGFTARFDWACPVASNSDEVFTALVASGSSVYVAGYYSGTGLSFGPATLPLTQGISDMMLGRLTDLGTSYRIDWGMAAGGYSEDKPTSLALSDNRLYLAGRYSSLSSSQPDAFVARLTDTGRTPSALDWLLLAPGNTREEATAVAVQGPYVYIAGYFYSTSISFGNTQLYNSTPTNNQSNDGFVAGLVDSGPSARFVWAKSIAGTAGTTEYCNSLAVAGKFVYVSGSYGGMPASFGSLSLAAPTGTAEGFVARLQEVGATTTFDRAQRVSSYGSDDVLSLGALGQQIYALGVLGGSGPAELGTTTLSGPGTFLARLTDSDIDGNSGSLDYGNTLFCRAAASIQPTLIGMPTGGSYVATPTGLDLDAQTGRINLAASVAGQYTVTYVSPGQCGLQASQTLTLRDSFTATFTYPTGAACSGTLAPVLAAGATAGRFSSTTGLALDATTGVVTLASSQPGTYVVTNTVAESGGCAAVSSTATLVVSAPAEASFAYASGGRYCAGSPSQVPKVSGTAGGRFSISPTSGLALDATLGTLTVAGSTPGTYIVTYTVGTTCPVSASQTIVVLAAPAAPTLTVSGIPATGLTLTASPGSSYQFYRDGVAISGATAPTFFINSGAFNSSYTVVVTNADGCASRPSAPLTPTPLPVQLTAFTAQLTAGHTVQLNWATATEQQTDHFEVQRSTDGVNFAHTLVRQPAAGISASTRTYQALDNTLLAGLTTVYYRLKMVDTDGSVSYSPVCSVALTNATGIALYPNPTHQLATLTGAAPKATVQVFDTLGRTLLIVMADTEGTARLLFPSGLVPGVYIVRTGSQALRLLLD